jgi:hypothetical protein
MDYPGIYVRWLAVQHAIQDDGRFVGRQNLPSICEPNVPEVLVFPNSNRTTAKKSEILSRLDRVLDENHGEFAKELETRVRCGTMSPLQERYKVVEQNGKVLQCLCMHGALWGQWLYPLHRILEHRISEGVMQYRVWFSGYSRNDAWERKWIHQADEIVGQSDLIAEYWKDYWHHNGIRSVVALGPVLGHTVMKDGSLWYRILKGANQEEVWVTEAMIDHQKELLVNYYKSLSATERQLLGRFGYRQHEVLQLQEPRKDHDGPVTPEVSGHSSIAISTIPAPYSESDTTTTEPVETPPPSEIAPHESTLVPTALLQLVLPRLQSFLEFHCRYFLVRNQMGIDLGDSILSANLQECLASIESCKPSPPTISIIHGLVARRTQISEMSVLTLLEAVQHYVADLNGTRAAESMWQLQERFWQRLEEYQGPDRLEKMLRERLGELWSHELPATREMELLRQAMADVHRARDWVRLNVIKNLREDVEKFLFWDFAKEDESSAEEEVNSAWRLLARSKGGFAA